MTTPAIRDATLFITGANRGLGRAFAREALARGARVYAAVRDPARIELPGAIPAASKAAAWMLTNALRIELQPQNTRVVALHAGFIDTDLASGFDAPKSSPEAIARTAFDALEAGALEILADDASRSVHAALTAQPPVYLQARPA